MDIAHQRRRLHSRGTSFLSKEDTSFCLIVKVSASMWFFGRLARCTDLNVFWAIVAVYSRVRFNVQWLVLQRRGRRPSLYTNLCVMTCRGFYAYPRLNRRRHRLLTCRMSLSAPLYDEGPVANGLGIGVSLRFRCGFRSLIGKRRPPGNRGAQGFSIG